MSTAHRPADRTAFCLLPSVIIEPVQPVISAAQMREIDRLTTVEFDTPSLLLMEAAAAASLHVLTQKFSNNLARKKARILCGPGNNGGDGAALARGLAHHGVYTDLILFGKVDETKGDARTNFEIVRRLASFKAGSSTNPAPLNFVECTTLPEWEELAQPRKAYDIIVDALFGTGLTRPLAGVFLQVVEHLELIINARASSGALRPFVISLDIPSGLNADLAYPIGAAVHADLTMTFTAPKPANVLPPASHLGGQLQVANIGSPDSLIELARTDLFLTEENDARDWLVKTRYTADAYKNTHGHALIIAGSRGYSGAAALCANAAMRSGAGLVTVGSPASAQAAVATVVIPEIMTTALAETDRGAVSDEAIEHVRSLAAKANVVAIGPGLSTSDERTRNFVRAVVAERVTPVVIDADGLNCLAPWPQTLRGSHEYPLVLTPHQGEMLRLLGTDNKAALFDRVAAAREFARAHQLILVLKGSRSIVAAPDGRVFVNQTGNAGLGTAGAGDTLTGIITGFLAQAYGTLRNDADALSATLAALYIGGLAGDLAAAELGMRTMLASDIQRHLSAAIRTLDPNGERP
jgi:ADP-dependent NAD(P)H-hydrate dehydratase / NAD(P)H-hydrate epimerase